MLNFNVILSLVVFITFSSVLNGQLTSVNIKGTKSKNLGDITNAFTDINAAYTNQAGLAFIRGLGVNLSYENRFLTGELHTMGFAVAKKFRKIGSFGITFKKFGIEEFNEFQIGASYSKKLNKSIAIGLQINFFNLAIEGYGNKASASFETGAIYNISNEITLGFHVKNPFPIKFVESTELPTIVSLGLKYAISSSLNVYGEIEKNINKKTLIKSGIEYMPTDFFSLYLGLKYDLQEYSDYSLGVGFLITEKIKAELGTAYQLELGLSPNIAFSYMPE